MVKAPIIILIAVPLGILLWLLWRRAQTGTDEGRFGNGPTDGGIMADEVHAPIHDADRSAECPSNSGPLEGSNETGAFDAEVRAEKEEPHGFVADVEPPSQGPNPQPFGEGNGIETIAGRLADASEELPGIDLAPVVCPSSIAISPAPEPLAAPPILRMMPHHEFVESYIADINSRSSAEELTAPVAVVSIGFGNDLQTDTALPETQQPEAAESSGDGLTEEMAGVGGVLLLDQAGPVERENEKTPQRYRPPPQKPPRLGAARPTRQELQRVAPSEVSLDIRVRLTFDRFGFCIISLLPVRTLDLDSEVTVKMGRVPLLLVAQEDWYQDIQVENIGGCLREGVELRGALADERNARWLLTGRDLYVLASHQRASGFVSTSRLSLGRSHVVLCSDESIHNVESVLKEAGCEGYTRLDESHGVPSGWVGLRNVTPTKAIPLNLGSDPFYAVKPAPDIEIDLEGGVCLRNSVWLAGYPPRIRLLGESSAAVRVLIDDKEAQPTAEGFFIVDGYDTSGRHSVYCEGLSCSSSYSIEEPPDSWQEWPAHHFAQADICGPLVQPAAESVSGRLFTGPMSNPLLLGAEPGQIFRCSPRNVALWKGFVPFDVVWALPAQPLQCNKKTARILQFANTPVDAFRHGQKTGARLEQRHSRCISKGAADRKRIS